ncbi:MAG TPA: flagellin [Devosia sp.]|jgi:flagellin-like hook-associated protein FlgL|uniref:flagellin N-terminal helical domain-containing protein n=1 Tax=Devosia sp. TaxID=1871048 RepID=UPI002F923B93
MSDISLSKAVRTNLLSLQNTADMMAKTQERLATGNKVNSALDNPTNFFTASALNSRAGDMNSLMDSMSNGIKTLEAADNGLTSITKTLESMQSTLRQARQDKSFQTDTYEVKAESTLKLSGGRFGEMREIRLQAPTGGEKAQLTGALPYADPIAVAPEGNGARTLIAYDASFSQNDKLRIDGKEVTLGAGAYANASDLADRISAALTTAGITGYTVNDTGTSVFIEQADKTLPSPKIEFVTGVNTATYGETSFIYDAADIGTVTAGGQNITTGGGTFEEFVDSLNEKAEVGGYKVTADPATKRITLVSTTPGGTAPTITGIRENAPATGASHTFDVNLANVNGSSVFGSAAFGAAPASVSAMITTLNADAGFNASYVASDDGTGRLVVTSKTPGTASPTVNPAGGGAGLTSVPGSAEAGAEAITDGIAVTRTAGVNGAFLTEVEAASHKITLTYGTKSADVNIVGRDSSLFKETNQLKLINDQLKAAGINDLEATFDADDKLVFTSTTAESKTLAVSGESSNLLFGSATVDTGNPPVSAYKSSNAVDQFVEEINRNPETAGFIRASNDNGKLRIENLSTQELAVEFDKDGDGVGASTNHKIGGNSVRGSLANEYNDLKNQLDRLADDASFNGINLLRGDNLRITFNESGNSFIEIQTEGQDGINAGTLQLDQLAAIDLDQDVSIDALLNDVKLALNQVRTQASQFGSNLSIVQNRQDFTKQMINTLETGAANLTLADMNEEAANLLALQTRQSLSSSSLSLASQADQSILQLLQ